MTNRSLIIIDELCRSTSVEEGTAIAMAICEDLARSGAYTYVTTHYTMLTKLADLFVNIKVWQMQTIPSGDSNNPKKMKLDYKYNLIPGATTLRGYGIYMVRNIWPPEALKHVDAFQEQFARTTNDPEFPTIDKRVRLRYDLECKLKKLKLQKKLTVANLNKHISDYNNEMAKLGEPLHNSQIVLQDLHSTAGEEVGLDHSIFNVSRNNSYEYSAAENSKIYLNEFDEGDDAFHIRVSDHQELFPIYPEELNNSEEDDVILSPVSTQSAAQTSITSPATRKRQMQEVFTPDTNLKIFQSQSSCHSASNRYFGLFVPEVNLSYTASNCSLNLTKNALSLEDNSQIRNFAEDSQMNNSQMSFYETQRSRNFFKGSQGVSYGASQDSSRDLSQQLDMIREQERSITFANESPHHLPEHSSEPILKFAEIESPFVNTFVRPLQNDITKTSTPMITKIKHNAQNFGSTSTSTRDSFGNRMQITTPKISFTILNRVDDVDLQSVTEDLESFVEEMQNEDFLFDQYGTDSKEQNDTSKDKEDNNQNESNNPMTALVESTDSDQVNVDRNSQKHRNVHLFPAVNVIEGPNNPSFEEDTNFTFVDKETVVRPIVRNPQPPPRNQEQEDVSIKAFHSLSEPNYSVLHNYSKNQTESHIDKSFTKGDDIDVDQRDSNSKKQTFDLEGQDAEKNVDILIKAFNSLSNPRETTIISDKNVRNLNKNDKSNQFEKRIATQYVGAGENDETADHFDDESARNVDAGKEDVTMESINNYQDGTTDQSSYLSAQSRQNTSYFRPDRPNRSSADSITLTGYGTEGHPNDTKNTNGICNENSNFSNFDKSILSETSELSDTDYNKSTEEVSFSRHNNVEQDGTETEEVSQNFFSLSDCNTISPQENRSNKRKSKFYSNISAESDSFSNYEDAAINFSSPLKDLNLKSAKGLNKDTESPHSNFLECNTRSGNGSIRGYDLKSEATNTKDRRTNHESLSVESDSSLEYGDVSATDVIQTVDEGTLNTKYKVGECEEAVQKQMELMEKISHMTDKPKERSEDKEHGLEKNISAPHIPYLSDYNSCTSSAASDEGNKEVSKNSCTEELSGSNTSQTANVFSRKPTLGIARYKRRTNDSKLRRKFKKSGNGDKKRIDQENVRPKEAEETTITRFEKNINNGSVTDASLEKDADESLEKNKPEEVTSLTDTDAESDRTKVVTTLSRNINRRSLKRRKFSYNGSTSFLGHSTQNRDIEGKTSTSISEASKRRNLERDFSSSSSDVKKYRLGNASCNREECDERSSNGQQEKTVTSISDASRKRNLDRSTNSSSSDKRPARDNAADQSASSLVFTQTTNRSHPKKPRKSGKPIAKETNEQSTDSIIYSGSPKADTTNTKGLFLLKSRLLIPSKLSKKAIQEAFYEEDRKFFESSGSSAELAKIWEQRLRRPTVRQIQQSTCLATIRKSGEGIEVIPEKKKTKRKCSKKEKKLPSGISSVNMNMFSDENAETFDLFIKSDTKDFKLFNFGNATASTSRNDGNMFDFKQVNSVPSAYNQNRNPSEEFPSMSHQSSGNLRFLTPEADFSLTPEGFYKQNRDQIGQLLRKYN